MESGAKEGGRSGSPALLALRWLKAKESARPRTRPGRDLLPSSFLHPARSPRHTAPLSCLLHRILSFSLFSVLSFTLCPSIIRKQLHHGRAAAFEGLLRACGQFRAPTQNKKRNKKKNSRATRAHSSIIIVIHFLSLRYNT